MVAWMKGRTAGLLLAIAGAIIWLIADLLGGHVYSNLTIPYWNATVRLGFFFIVSHTLTKAKVFRDQKEAMSRFVIHDLRSPLNNVMTGLSLLEDNAQETMDASQKKLVEMSQISCDRMLTLLNTLLDLAQLERGSMPLNREMVKVKDLVESSLEQVSVWASQINVKLACELDSSIETVFADPSLSIRILVNLLSNAIKFSRAGAVVVVRSSPRESGMLMFSVIDHGRGIPPEWVSKVFDQYAQVDAYNKEGVIGSGLGLTFCRYAVKAQGGRIWLESEVGKGTNLSFTLPVHGRNISS